MINKRKIVFIFIAALFLVLALYGSISVINAGRVEVKEAEYKITPDDNIKDIYLVKEYLGGIGVYLKSDEEYVLSKILNTQVLSLPDADREALKEGIYISDEEKLIMLLEDYSD